MKSSSVFTKLSKLTTRVPSKIWASANLPQEIALAYSNLPKNCPKLLKLCPNAGKYLPKLCTSLPSCHQLSSLFYCYRDYDRFFKKRSSFKHGSLICTNSIRLYNKKKSLLKNGSFFFCKFERSLKKNFILQRINAQTQISAPILLVSNT